MRNAGFGSIFRPANNPTQKKAWRFIPRNKPWDRDLNKANDQRKTLIYKDAQGRVSAWTNAIVTPKEAEKHTKPNITEILEARFTRTVIQKEE